MATRSSGHDPAGAWDPILLNWAAAHLDGGRARPHGTGFAGPRAGIPASIASRTVRPF
jgi:hypothetical protein